MDRISGRILNVEADRDGSTVTQDALSGTSTLYMEDATDFTETGGQLVLLDGSRVTYDSADMDEDTVTLTDPLVDDVLDYGELVGSQRLVQPGDLIRPADERDAARGWGRLRHATGILGIIASRAG